MINDKLRPYEGHDYEKVMLLTYMALNYLARATTTTRASRSSRRTSSRR